MFNLWRINKRIPKIKKVATNEELCSNNVKEVLGDSDDVIVRDVYVNKNVKVTVIAIDGMVNSEIIDAYVIRPLILSDKAVSSRNEEELYNRVNNGILYHISQESLKNTDEAIYEILKGVTVIFFDGIKKAVAFDAKDIPKRSISEPETESVLKGAKDAFIENIRTNTALIRKKIKSPLVRFENFIVGKGTGTVVSISYLKGIADEDILEKIKEKIKNLDVNNLLSVGSFEEGISDNKYSIFPQMIFTERVDKFCSNITDGKVGVLIDGLPAGYILPAVFPMLFQAPEDYSENYAIGSATRVLRYICALITLFLPGFYISITTFHHEMIPNNLAVSIIESKQGVPFATVFEVIGLLIAFELLLEASLRLPKTIGATISIIGGLIVGEAAVNAQFISPAVVVIIAITGIAGFVVPNQELSNSLRICRLFLVLCASVAGLFGLSFGFIIIMYYLCSIETLGIPYMVPYVANEGKAFLDDTIVRTPKDVIGGKTDK